MLVTYSFVHAIKKKEHLKPPFIDIMDASILNEVNCAKLLLQGC